MLTAFYDPGFAAPLGEHQMPIQKFALLAETLAGEPDIQLESPAPITEEALRRVHSKAYLEAVRTGEPRALAESQKFPWSPELFPSVCLTNGACLAAGRQALRDGASAALASGFHHASAEHGEGYCTFNGLIVTADELHQRGEVERVAILDLDLHYGNGTAQLAATRAHVFQVSIYGNDYWNNRPYRNVTVRRHTDGPNHHSFALPAGCDRATLLATMERAWPLLAAFRPSLLLYQAGADPYHEDPYSPLALDQADLQARDAEVFAWAKCAQVPVAWVLAGGYTKDIRKVVEIHANTFCAWREVYGPSTG